MSYSGLRGAIAYGLAQSIDGELIGHEVKGAYLTSTIFIVLATVFLQASHHQVINVDEEMILMQGTTIKPIVNCLGVAKDEEDRKAVYNVVFKDSLDHAAAGIEAILGLFLATSSILSPAMT